MKHTHFRFSNLKSMGYDQATGTLEVQFKGRIPSVYKYFDIPPSVAEGLRSSKAPGKYLAEMIKPNYRHERVITRQAVASSPVSVDHISDPFKEQK